MTDIDQLKKAFQQAISTSASVAASNEPLTRRDAVQSGQVFSAPIVQGGLGSWVASSGYPFSSTTPAGVQLGAVAPSRNSFEMAPGLPGVPDVDFVPYNWNTNRFGGKGGALLGHPISWEVVGPTLKSPYCDWQWHVDTTGLTNDVLTLEIGPNPLLGAVPTVAEAYNYSANFDAEGGLYVLFTFTGEGFDGSLAAPRTPITGTNYRLRYELFRVGSIAPQAITLRGEKRVGDYFTGGGDGCRAITLIRPKVTRLAPLPAPKNGVGQTNRIFVFLPPEVSATSEYNPPYNDGGSGPGTWLGGAFDVAGALPSGTAVDYGGTNPLPIPRPVAETSGTVATAAVVDAAKWEVVVDTTALPAGFSLSDRIVRVYNIRRTLVIFNGSDANALGYFVTTKVSIPGPGLASLTLRRVPEVNPDTGAVFWGNGPFGPSAGVRVQFFDSIESLFTDASLNYTKLAAARLTNLIDPRTAGPSIAYRDTTGGNAVPASKPDRAIFNTKPGEDPGNLLDLGFRAVYFPAKLVGGNAVPDFDKPLDSEDVQLTPNPTSRQFIETDYSAGVAYLSDVPDSGNAACQVAPSAAPFGATNNPREEVVLFAACVPYSMEEGQTGDGIRLTASSLASAAEGFGDDDYADVYGRRVILKPNVNQVLTPAPGASLTTTLTNLSDIPSAGFFFLVSRGGFTGLTNRRGPYYYQSTSLTAGPPSVVSLDGISGPAGATAVNATGLTKDQIVLQRSLRSFAPTSASADTVRGSSKRISTLSFKGADVTFGADGSVSVEPRTTLQKAYEAGNRIDVTSAEGRVEILSSTDATDNLYLGRTFAGVGNALVVSMGAGTTKSGVLVGLNGVGIGVEIGIPAASPGSGVSVAHSNVASTGDGVSVYHSGTGASATGVYVQMASATAGQGLRVEMPDSGTTGDGVSVEHDGLGGDGIQVLRNSATAGAGVRVDMVNAGATGPGVWVTHSGGTGAEGVLIDVGGLAPGLPEGTRVNVSGTGGIAHKINVSNTATNGYGIWADHDAATGTGAVFYMGGDSVGVAAVMVGGTASSTNPAFLANIADPGATSAGLRVENLGSGNNLESTDGTNTTFSVTKAGAVTANSYLYSFPYPQRKVVVSFVGQMAAYGMRGAGSRWDRGVGGDDTARYLVGNAVNATTVLDLNSVLPDGVKITDIELWVDAAAAGFFAELENSFLSSVFPAVPPLPITNVASVTAGAAGWQQLSMSASLGAGHTVNKRDRDYWLYVRNNPTVIGDQLHGIIIYFDDPGPRNY